MANNKKNYLFRLGPMLFFPNDTEEKSQDTKNKNEQWQIIIRLGIIIIFGQLTYYLFRSSDVGNIFAGTESYPDYYYLWFFVPLVISVADIYRMVRKKPDTHINPLTRYMIYGVWLISALFYGLYIYKGLLI
jgi:hypothetical protein